MAAPLKVGGQPVCGLHATRPIRIGPPGLLAVRARQPAEEVLERAILHHHPDNVLDARSSWLREAVRRGGDGPYPATLAEREQPRRRCHALEPPASAQPRRCRAASTASIPCPHAAPPCLPRRALADGQPRRPGTCAGVWSTPGTGLWERLRSGRAADGGSHHPCHPCLVAGRASPCLYPVNPSLSRNHAAHTRKRPRVRAQWTRALWGLRAVPSRRPRVPRTSTRSWCGFLPRRGSRVWSELGTPGADVRQSPCCGSVTHQATRQGLSNTDVVGEFMKPLYLRQR